MVGEVKDLWAVIWNMYLNFVLFEILIDLRLWGTTVDQQRYWGKDG